MSTLEKPPQKRTLTSSLRSIRRRPSRRPHISPPSNFRHIYSHSHVFSAEAFEYAGPVDRQPPSVFLRADKDVPSALPRSADEQVATPPPVAWLRDARDSLDTKGSGEFELRKSGSTLSFHVPRRHVGTPPPPSLYGSPGLRVAPLGLRFTSPPSPPSPSIYGSPGVRVEPLGLKFGSPPPPEVPPKSRARAYTAPEAVDELRARIAGAMLERERLQGMIDEIMERQSVYMGSRSGTPQSAARSSAGEWCSFCCFSRCGLWGCCVCTDMGVDEHLPAIPALPPSAPSFAERLNPDLRRAPQTPTAPSPAHHSFPNTLPTPDTNANIPANTAPNASFPELVPRPLQIIPFQGPPTPPRSRGAEDNTPLQPPLPLVLRPPLRKKKSFSSVSAWLFPGGHGRVASAGSVTNAPGPVREGFYQCVSPPVTAGGRGSGETAWSFGARVGAEEEGEGEEDGEGEGEGEGGLWGLTGEEDWRGSGEETMPAEVGGLGGPGLRRASTFGERQARRVGVAV